MNTLIKQVDSRAVSVEVTGRSHLPIQRPYVMHPTGMLSPARVDMRWENGELVELAVAGRRLKKDGTVGHDVATTWYVSYGKTQQTHWPHWLTALVAQYDPAVPS